MKKITFLITTFTLIFLTGTWAGDLPDLGDSSQADLPTHEERKIADEVTLELLLSGDMMDDPEIGDYLERLGYRLVASSPDNRQPFRFFTLLDQQINAFAVPGGVVCVNGGLIVLTQHESELAAVLAHEISHVTQHHYARMLQSSKGSQYAALAGMVAGILAARNSPTSAEAMIATSQGVAAQSYLSFSRDFEREADRIGMQTLEKSGFDPRAMPTFFDRMQRYYSNVDNGAFAFLRTHPVTNERISDSLQRAEKFPYKQLPDSDDYLYVREKTRVAQMGAREALTFYQGTTSQKKYADPVAQHYGYAVALAQLSRFDEAWKELDLARKNAPRLHPMIESLAGNIRLGQHQIDAASEIFESALQHFPSAPALVNGSIDIAIAREHYRDAIDLVHNAQQMRPGDPALYKRLADTYAKMDDQFQSHRAQGEFYAARGQWTAAIEQLQIARRKGSDFFQMSAVDARIKEFQQKLEKPRNPLRGPQDEDKNPQSTRGGDGN